MTRNRYKIIFALVLLSALTPTALSQNVNSSHSVRRQVEEPTTKVVGRPTMGVLTRDLRMRYTRVQLAPCSIITREEIEAILKRNDNDRALEAVQKAAV